MEPSYRITVDRRRKLLHTELRGQWDLALVDTWGAERLAAVARIGNIGDYLALYDASRVELPTQELFARIQHYLSDPATWCRRAAIVTGSAIQRMQIRRMTSHHTVAFFGDLAAAEAWLFEDAADEERPAA